MPTQGRVIYDGAADIVEDLSQYKWSSYLYYTHGLKNDIITADPMYAALENILIEQQKVYREYVLTDRAYEDIIDKEFKINKVAGCNQVGRL